MPINDFTQIITDLIFDKLPAGALILADNTLWDGKVLEPLHPADKQTAGILLHLINKISWSESGEGDSAASGRTYNDFGK